MTIEKKCGMRAGADGLTVRSLLRQRYAEYFSRRMPSEWSLDNYKAMCRLYNWDVYPWLPEWRDQPVVEIGSGYGYFADYLLDKAFTDITIVDASIGLVEGIRKRLGNSLSGAHHGDGKSFLLDYDSHFGLIVLFDVIEHLTLEEAYELLVASRRALSPGGKVLIRTPNMANILAGYSRYSDLTHEFGYTDFTLENLLLFAGFDAVRICMRKRRRTLRGQVAEMLNNALHQFLFRMQSRSPVRIYRSNIMLSGEVTTKQ
jgi:SAM-dependent methyltransferase